VQDFFNWRFYSAVVFICVAVGSFLYKRAQMLGIRPGSFMVVQTISFFGTVVLANIMWGDFNFGSPYLVLGVLAGTVGIIGAFSTLHSMKLGELGTNIAIVRLSFVPAVIGAILFLHEPITFQKGVIVLFAGLAVFFFFDHYRKENRLALGSLASALTACMAFGIFDIVYKTSTMLGINPLAFLIVQSGTASILINLYVIFREKYQINRAILQIAPVCGILFASACLAFLMALQEIDVSLIAPFIDLSFTLTYLLSVIFLRESVTKRKLLGIAMVVLSILLLYASGVKPLH
jgi:drug/metabolite transporter (DMT)-like permease